MGNTYYIVTRHKKDKYKKDKYLSFVQSVPNECADIYCRLKNIPDIESACIFPSKKKAEEICKKWNDGYREAGTLWGC